MSNNQVGTIYQQIIADVVESSRVDFEEGGVDERVLEELRQGWQQKLSQLSVATFPWDPKPEPVQAPVITNPPTLPSNSGNYQQMPAVTAPQAQQSLPQMPQMNNGPPRIKSEPGQDGSGLGMPQAPYNVAGLTAQERAAQNLQAAYGSRAAASIEQIRGAAAPSQNPSQGVQQMNQQYHQQQMQQMQQMQRGPAGQQPRGPPMSQEQLQQYRSAQAANVQQQMQKVNGVNGAQTDGPGDDMEESVGVITRFNANGVEEPMGRVEIDNLIRSKIEAMGQSMEGGGLMLPLKQAAKTGKNRQRKVKTSSTGGLAQQDGGDDDDDDEDKANLKDDDLDEDAINSDLDDPDDGLNDDEDDDEGMGHIMLCMYDKVQRVKNKWKCVMKDGVLTVNGKEYVFHKASGEYEW